MKIYQVDAFTSQLFGGNPAAVVPLSEQAISDEQMQSIATENNLSETAFYRPSLGSCDFDLRWFTPVAEVALCGHATLATAHVLYAHEDWTKDSISFHTLSGTLVVRKVATGYAMDFPTDTLRAATRELPLLQQLGAKLQAAYIGKDDALIVLESEKALRAFRPDMSIIMQLQERRGLIATAPGDTVDFVSRCFFPRYGIPEDPVTGSAHTTLTPFWAKELDKSLLSARQISKRGGVLSCEWQGARTILTGNAVTYLTGTILTR